MALPFGLTLSLCLRGWIGALVLAAARLSGDTSRAIYTRDAAPRILYVEVLRAEVHRFVRAAGGNARQLARAANAETYADGTAYAATGVGANWAGARRILIR